MNLMTWSLLTRLLVPELQTHAEYFSLNVARMAAFTPMPLKTVYPASKACVSSFSRSLARELKEASINVGVLHPGPILTNPDVIIRIIKQGKNGKRGLFPARVLARMSIDGVRKGKHIMVPGLANKLNRFFLATMPSGILMSFLFKVGSREIAEEKKYAA